MNKVGKALLIALPFTVVIAAVSFIGSQVRDGTVSDSQVAHRQAVAANAFWTALALDQHLDDPELEDLRLRTSHKLDEPNPAHALLTTRIQPHQLKHVNDLLGFEAIHYPCYWQGEDDATCDERSDSGILSHDFALGALQATPDVYQTLLEDVPPVKYDGLFSFTKAFWATGVTALLVTLFSLLVMGVASLTRARRRHRDRRREQEKDRRYLAGLPPRERNVIMIRREVETWPDSKQKVDALNKADEALKLVRAERKLDDEAQSNTTIRELDALVTDSKNWQDAYRSQL